MTHLQHQQRESPQPTPLTAALSDIKLAHSVFALPFAVLAAFLAAAPFPNPSRFAAQLALVVVCMVLARTWAMLLNRLADRKIDADNPRTARRALAAGRLTPRAGWAIAAACAALFLLTCSAFHILLHNPWPIALAPLVLAWLALYAYTKRFTFLCHFFLGSALAISPIAAVIAIDPTHLTMTPSALTLTGYLTPTAHAVFYLCAFVLLWVAGFDITYALQDLDFDRDAGLHSVPARFGWRRALWIARILHAVAFLALIAAIRTAPQLGVITAAAATLVAALLIYEHIVLARRGAAGIPMAFFTINGVVSLILGTAGITDTLM